MERAEQTDRRLDYVYAGTDQVELIAETGRTYTYGRTNSSGLPIIESFSNGASTYSYTYDPQGTPLALEGGNSHYLTLDGLGSVVALINHDGATTATYTYDPWGQATATAIGGSTAIGLQLYGYAGGLDDPRSTLIKYGQRWYDPSIGRFTQQDSLETLADPTRANRYEYANSNPTNYVDPSGLDKCYYSGAYGRTYCIGSPSAEDRLTPLQAVCRVVAIATAFSAVGLFVKAVSIGSAVRVGQGALATSAGAASFSVAC